MKTADYVKKTVCLALAGVQLLLTLSCSQTEEQQESESLPAETASQPEGESLESEPEETDPQPNLPEMNFGGDDFVFLDREMSGDWEAADIKDIYAEELNGEGLNDAVFNRNQYMFDNYNIVIREHKSNNCTSEITSSIAARDGSYDVAYISVGDDIAYAQKGNFLDYYKMDYIDFEQPWWDSNAEESLSICNKLYSAVNDIMLANNNATTAILVNKKMWDDYGFEGSPYELVKDYEWSIDKLSELSKRVCNDVDGNGEYDENDIYGFMCYRDASLSLFHSSGGRICRKNDEGGIDFTIMDENTYDALIASLTLMAEPSTFNLHKVLESKYPSSLYTVAQNMFMADQGLFYWILVHDIQKFRDMESDFGILPIASSDPETTGYGSNVNQYHGCLMSVLCTADPSQAGFVLEAMAAKSRYTVQNEYYDICLSRKYSRDDESAEMLDIIFGNRIYDIGAYYSIGNVSWQILMLTMTNSTDISSYARKQEKGVSKVLGRLVEVYDKLE